MVEISYDEMHRLIDAGNNAYIYAWKHYEELAARKTVYTLYGPAEYSLGAVSPCHLVYARSRKLLKKTRRKEFTQYEFDEEYRPVRVMHFGDYDKLDCTYHVFELDGITYGCPFSGNEKRHYNWKVEAIKFENKRPIWYSETQSNSLFAEFYEYPSDGKRLCTGYMYCRTCEKTLYRQEPNWDAPYGAPDSPVTVHCYEDSLGEMDFSKWFEAGR